MSSQISSCSSLTIEQLRTAQPWVLAFVYLGLNQNEDAIKQLQAGIRIRDAGLMFIGFDRRFDPLRQDARFQEIMKTIGLTK